jgi:acyl transferase domain-containing protein
VNGATLCVVSGDQEAIERLEERLASRGIACKRLHTSHAFHSAMMDPILGPFAALVARTKRSAPRIPYISNVTGAWISEGEAMDPEYWAKHLRQTVRCAEGLAELLKSGSRIFLEVGPGQTMTGLTRQHPGKTRDTAVIPSLLRANETSSDNEALLNATAQLWLWGQALDWQNIYRGEKRRRLPMPTYPFERKRFWVEPIGSRRNGEEGVLSASNSNDRSNGEPKLELNESHRVEGGGASDMGAARKDRIATALRKLFRDLSGRDLSEINGGTTFIEMGFDSLFLTQATISLEKKFNVRVAFRDLLDSLSTFDLLAAHVESALPEKSRDRGESAQVIRRRLDSSKAEELLERLDELSDSEVEALLSAGDQILS